MTPDQVKRKLTAILSADVKGYSLLNTEESHCSCRSAIFLMVRNG